MKEIEEKPYYSLKDVLDLGENKIQWLLENVFPKYGVMSLVGSSDTGKSFFLRQICLHICAGKNSFIGRKLSTTHQAAIYVSTEDDLSNMKPLLSKQLAKLGVPDSSKLKFIFDGANIFKKLEKMIAIQRVDCIVVDAFGDMFRGDLNQSSKVRQYIEGYKNISKKYNCAIIFLHHTGKGKQNIIPSKDNVLGSVGFEGSMRTVVELAKSDKDFENRNLIILKSNYLPQKEKSIVLKIPFTDTVFGDENEELPFEDLVRSTSSDQKAKRNLRIEQLKSDGYDVFEIQGKLQQEGFKNIGKSTIYDVIKSLPTFQNPKEIENLENDVKPLKINKEDFEISV